MTELSRPVLFLWSSWTIVFLSYLHFKMDCLNKAAAIMKQAYFYASVHLKDANYSVRLHPNFTEFFRFMFPDRRFEFVVVPLGAGDSVRTFTELLKPAVSQLWALGFTILIYICRVVVRGVEGKQVGSMDEEPQVRGCYNFYLYTNQPGNRILHIACHLPHELHTSDACHLKPWFQYQALCEGSAVW